MTVQNLYTQYLDGKVTKAKFLYEVRRDQNLDMISHHNNFDDTIKILKNKNIISEKASKDSKQPTGKQEVDVIAKTIDMVLKLDKEIVDKISSAGRKNIEQNFSSKQMCDLTLDIYRQVLN